MNWIDVEDDLPPYDVPMLVVGEFRNHMGRMSWMMQEASFNPKTGWRTSLDEVHYWAPMIPLPERKEKVEVTSSDD